MELLAKASASHGRLSLTRSAASTSSTSKSGAVIRSASQRPESGLVLMLRDGSLPVRRARSDDGSKARRDRRAPDAAALPAARRGSGNLWKHAGIQRRSNGPPPRTAVLHSRTDVLGEPRFFARCRDHRFADVEPEYAHGWRGVSGLRRLVAAPPAVSTRGRLSEGATRPTGQQLSAGGPSMWLRANRWVRLVQRRCSCVDAPIDVLVRCGPRIAIVTVVPRLDLPSMAAESMGKERIV